MGRYVPPVVDRGHPLDPSTGACPKLLCQEISVNIKNFKSRFSASNSKLPVESGFLYLVSEIINIFHNPEVAICVESGFFSLFWRVFVPLDLARY